MGFWNTVCGSIGCRSLSIFVEKISGEKTAAGFGVIELWNSTTTASGKDGVLVMVGVAVTSGVSVMVAVSVIVGVGVIERTGVIEGVKMAVAVGGKYLYATGRPYTGSTTANSTSSTDSPSMRQPPASRWRRSR